MLIRIKIYLLLFISVVVITLISCEDNTGNQNTINCSSDNSLDMIATRNFNMGFSTWPYGPDEEDKINTYQFISQHADIYSEQIDDKIPWDAFINNNELPDGFINDIDFRLSNKLSGHKLLLSVSLLNSDRDDLLEDYDGKIPSYVALDDQIIENAYFKYLDYLIKRFNPDYLVYAMEVNDLKIKSKERWLEYKSLASNIRRRLKESYPDLPTSESVTLHNYFKPEVTNPEDFITEISDYINQNTDFAAISFYPFFKGLHSKADYQEAFDFLHSKINKSIAFVETTHLAETLEIKNINLNITGNVCEQKDYLEILLLNAYQNNYDFIIWWSFQDFDELWETFADEYKELGKIWRDTGILNEDSEERPAYNIWEMIINR